MVDVLGEADNLHNRIRESQQTKYNISFARIYSVFVQNALLHI